MAARWRQQGACTPGEPSATSSLSLGRRSSPVSALTLQERLSVPLQVYNSELQRVLGSDDPRGVSRRLLAHTSD